MNGLEKIIEKINEECAKNCAVINEKAKQTAKEAEEEYVGNAKREADKIIEKAKVQCDLTAQKAKSGAALLEKKIRLQVKNKIINNYIKDAKTALINMPDDEYFEMIAKLVGSYAKEGEGVLKFSEADLKRIPSDFEMTLNGALKSGAIVKISDTPIDTDGGFILSYDDIEENCTFTALIETNLDTIRDRLNCEIFG